MKFRKGLISIACLSLTWPVACKSDKKAAAPLEKILTGFEALKFGMSYDEALSLTRLDLFNPYSLKECEQDLPVRGCSLFADREAAPFQRIDGIPFGLSLDFNKRGRLTDMQLVFERSNSSASEERGIGREACMDIVDRTADWAAATYGALSERKLKGEQASWKTRKGTAYWLSRQPKLDAFIAEGERKFADGRSIWLFAVYLGNELDSCRIAVNFKDAESIERREIKPETQKKVDALVEANAGQASVPDAETESTDIDEADGTTSQDFEYIVQ